MVREVTAQSIIAMRIIRMSSWAVVQRVLLGGVTVAHDLRLCYNANDLHISSLPTHDANFTWFACFLQGVASGVARRVIKPYLLFFPPRSVIWSLSPNGHGQKVADVVE
ncbi:hypothetical protein TNCV_1987301 [Trichonephila clavipes]|nr:hypothetical protein TNCV_1987301 [Trichonephila clavipes]